MSDHIIFGGKDLLAPRLARKPAITKLSKVLVVKFDPALVYVHGYPPDWVERGCAGGFYCFVDGQWEVLPADQHELVYAALSDLAHSVLQVLTVLDGERMSNGK